MLLFRCQFQSSPSSLTIYRPDQHLVCCITCVLLDWAIIGRQRRHFPSPALILPCLAPSPSRAWLPATHRPLHDCIGRTQSPHFVALLAYDRPGYGTASLLTGLYWPHSYRKRSTVYILQDSVKLTYWFIHASSDVAGSYQVNCPPIGRPRIFRGPYRARIGDFTSRPAARISHRTFARWMLRVNSIMLSFFGWLNCLLAIFPPTKRLDKFHSMHRTVNGPWSPWSSLCLKTATICSKSYCRLTSQGLEVVAISVRHSHGVLAHPPLHPLTRPFLSASSIC